MSTVTRVRNRVLAVLLTIMMIIAMIPVNMISASAATEDHQDVFTVTVKDSEKAVIDKVDIDYSVKVDGEEKLKDKVTTGTDGVAEIKDLDTLELSVDPVSEVTLDAEISKIGYEKVKLENEKIEDIKGNIDVELTAKETVTINISVNDSVSEAPVSDADIKIDGYHSLTGKSKNGTFEAVLYKGESYSLQATKKGYKPFSASDPLTFEESGEYKIAMEAKAVDDTFKFAEETPSDLEYGDDSYSNVATCKKSTGTITYSVVSGDSVSVDAESGVVTTLQAGTSTIQAILSEDENYQESKISYQITVTNAPDSGFGFTDPSPANKKYVKNGTYTNTASGGYGEGAVTYAVTAGNAATVDASTGTLTYKKAGTVTVTATRAADNRYAETSASYTLTIEKADQASFRFEVLSPENQYITHDTYTNEAVGGSGDGEITYSVAEGSEYAEIEDESSPEVTLKKVGGPVRINAVKAGDDGYEPASATYTFYIVKSPQEKLAFETTEKTVVYAPDLIYSNPLSGGSGTGAVTYEILSGDAAEIDKNTGNLTILKASDNKGVVVQATKSGDDKYEEQTARFTLIINKAEQTGFAFADGDSVSKVWSTENNVYTNVLSGGQSTGNVKYTFTASDMPFGGPCASFDKETGTVTMHGKGTVTIEAVKEGDDCYLPISAEYTLTINRAAQQGFAFTSSVPKALTYNDGDNKFDLSTEGGNGAGSVTYSVKTGDAVSINENHVTVLKSGKVEIKATKAETNEYEAATATLNLEIDKAPQYIAFENTTTTSVVYGNAFSNKANAVENTSVPDKKGYAPLTEITYSVIEGEDIVSVDKNGKLTFKNNATGKVKIKAEKPGDDCYKDTSAEYTLDVVFPEVPETAYLLDGAMLNDSGWYSDSVTITPPEGYQISYSNALTDNTWSDKLTVSEEGYNGKTIYLKNENGISGAVLIPENAIRIDRTAPVDLSISYSKPVMGALLEGMTFGFYQADVTVTIKATDETSHVASFEYTYGDQSGTIESSDMTFSNEDKTAEASFTISPQYRGKVSFKAVDTAGNFKEKYDDQVIVTDNIAPGVDVSFDNNDAVNNTYYADDRTATITIDEANFFAEALEKIDNIADDPSTVLEEHLVITVIKNDNDNKEQTKQYKNSDLTTPFTKTDEGKWTATLLFDEDADYTLKIDYKDFSGNVAETYEKSFTIDKTSPEINISYDNNEPQNETYYKNDRTAIVTVIEHNFRASDIVVETLTSTDVQGKSIELSKNYQDLLRNGEWVDDGNKHTISIPFDTNANYQFKITYADMANNAQTEPIVDAFTVDKNAPKELAVSYSKSVLDAFLESATFGFYQAPVTVTITADDSISGVDYFTYSYGVQVGASSTNIGKGDTVINRENIEYSNENKTAVASFTIPAQFRGCVSFAATDKAGNTSDVFNDDKVIVVDDVAPGVTVSYDPSEEKAVNGHYYGTDRTATITINEANFFNEAFEKIEDISLDPSEMIDEHLVITVKRTDDDNKTETKVIKSADLTTEFAETADDVWSATLLFDQDGAYEWTIEYKDFSGNIAGTFTDSFVIDKTSPNIDITYNNTDAQNENYYKADRTATIAVIERNFSRENIVVNHFTAVDVQGNEVDYGKNYQKLLRESEWNNIGNNTYTLEIPFDVDAKYSFEILFTDLADNSEVKAVTGDFIIDKIAPDNLKVSYSDSILDAVFGAATFGIYKAPVTVTIEADDVTSGVDYFTYSYVVTKGESNINEGKSDVVIPEEEITYTDKNKHASATFTIEPQFRGKVSFTATDRAGNTSEMYEDNKDIIVDNVAPGVSVTYDNNSATYDTYYNKPRTATIKINEANFFEESLGKVENIATDPGTMIDEHLVITVTEEDNDGKSTTKQIKKEDLTTQFVKSTEDTDTWVATLVFAKDADYKWSVNYKDFSGNEAGKFEDSFTVDNIDPIINVDFKNNDAKNEKYFKADRPTTLTITEHNFNAKDVKVEVDTSRATSKVTDYQAYLTDADHWKKVGNVYTAEIVFDAEAYYKFDISYTDMAGRKTDKDKVNYGDSVAPKDFVIDKTAPTNADITINNESVLATKGIAFEKFYQSSAVVKYSVNCDISELDNIKYQKVDSVAAYDPYAAWIDFNESVKIDPSEKFIIYFKAEDKAGNITIVNSTGIVVDDVPPEGERYAPDIDIEPETANENGLHNSNVNVALNVVEPRLNGSTRTDDGYYSGIKKITYRIYTKDTAASEQGTLLDAANGQTSGAVIDNDKLINKWSGSITVDSKFFNSNQVVVEVTAVDNAGNERVTTNEMIGNPIRIDVTPPSIDVSYQDGSDNGDATFTDSTNGAYFKNNRTATIVITERNFDESKVKINATKDGQPYTPALSGWSTSVGGGNGDGTTHTATIIYSTDGIYAFDISFTDQAGNENTAVNYNGLSPQLFTIDKTNPVFSISYDNNSAQNGNYYKAQRIATLTIEERNFEESRINITLTANNNGSGVGTPAVNGWSTTGDTHTTTIEYSADALYEFDIEYSDKAGNPLSEDYPRDSFYIDQTKPKVSITKIVDKSANNDSGNIGYIITATDTNFDVFTPKLTALVREGNRFIPKELDVGSMTTVSNGRMYIVTNLPDDGVYKIYCTVVDKAGNAYEEVTLSKDKEDKETYTEKRAGNDTLLTFSINREGSTYNMDDNTINLLSRYYVQQVDDNIVIEEINVDTLKKRQVSINGRELAESEYGFDSSGGNDESWYRYRYSIDRTLFSDEGEYNVVVSSKDGADNDAFSDIKDAGIDFVVDRTAPIVTVTGLSNDGRYQTESQTVTAVPTDDGGALKSIVVTLIGKDGNDDKELLNLSDDNFMEALEEGDGKVTFEIPEGLYQDVRIICDDQAFYGDHENILYDEMFTNVSVTPNGFLIFWANKPLRYGILGGIVLIVAGIVALIIMKNRKKKKVTT